MDDDWRNAKDAELTEISEIGNSGDRERLCGWLKDNCTRDVAKLIGVLGHLGLTQKGAVDILREAVNALDRLGTLHDLLPFLTSVRNDREWCSSLEAMYIQNEFK